MNYIWIIFLALAAIANATMDTLKDHFTISIFRSKNKYFWNPEFSWDAHSKFLGIVELDAWHILKYMMLTFIFATAIFYKPIFPNYYDLLAMFIWWSLCFEIFYSKIYKS